jgi:signal transduction histidine kinase
MRRVTDRAQEITGGRAEIASMIAHELRGPVTTVKGLATTGARHYDSLGDPEKKEFFELIDQEARRLLHIVDETSMALKIDAGTLSYDIRPRTSRSSSPTAPGRPRPATTPSRSRPNPRSACRSTACA